MGSVTVTVLGMAQFWAWHKFWACFVSSTGAHLGHGSSCGLQTVLTCVKSARHFASGKMARLGMAEALGRHFAWRRHAGETGL